MSKPSRGGRGGKRHTPYDADSASREEIKRRKGCEAARKHRQKRLNELTDLQQRNEHLKKEIEDFTKKFTELKKLTEFAEKLLQQHRDAGCSLPEAHRDCSLLSGNPMFENDIFMNEGTSDTCQQATADSASEADQESGPQPQDSLPLASTDPKALFSGESLPLVALIPQQQTMPPTDSPNERQTFVSKESQNAQGVLPNQVAPSSQIPAQEQVRSQTGSPSMRQTFVSKESQNAQRLFATHLAPSGQRSTPLVPLASGQTTGQSVQEAQQQGTSTFFHMNQLSEELLAPGTQTVTCISQPQQGTNEIWKVGVLKMNGKSQKVLYNEKGQWMSLPASIEEQVDSISNSFSSADGDASSSAHVYQGNEMDTDANNSPFAGNIPDSQFLVDFDAPITSAEKCTYNTNQNLRQSCQMEKESCFNHATATATSHTTFQQQKPVTSASSSFAQDLARYGAQQHGRYERQSGTLQQQIGGNRVVVPHAPLPSSSTAMNSMEGQQIFSQGNIIMAAAPPTMSSSSTAMNTMEGQHIFSQGNIINASIPSPMPSSSTKIHPMRGQFFSQRNIMNNTAPLAMHFSTERKATAPAPSNCVNASVPAMLDMMSESQLSPSLQSTIEASLSNVSYSSVQTAPVQSKKLLAHLRQMENNIGEMSQSSVPTAPGANQPSNPNHAMGPGLRFLNQARSNTPYGAPEEFVDMM
ncbi:hypothetical protein ElyMa_005637300 [Elysia marginata]|uniref:BZIP domain-containing protein n=1 Tax=Elysia marginata TaxID=1093978 RepID=A0AAV4FAG0_9GAST|nr:hypothetical protein ElyMa_005637300 [Elysia marginata]